jgi:hypothetical protein
MPANYSKQEKELGRTKWYYRGYNRSIIGPYPTEEEAFDSAANHGHGTSVTIVDERNHIIAEY